jgi:hypothetical protein
MGSVRVFWNWTEPNQTASKLIKSYEMHWKKYLSLGSVRIFSKPNRTETDIGLKNCEPNRSHHWFQAARIFSFICSKVSMPQCLYVLIFVRLNRYVQICKSSSGRRSLWFLLYISFLQPLLRLRIGAYCLCAVFSAAFRMFESSNTFSVLTLRITTSHRQTLFH